MRARKSTIQNEEGKNLATEIELACIIADTYSDLGADKFIQLKRYAWVLSGITLVIAIILAVIVTPLLLLLIVIAAAAAGYAYLSSLRVDIESIRRVHWLAKFEDVGDGHIMLDRSGTTSSTTFAFPVMRDNPDKLLSLNDRFKRLAEDDSILLPLHDVELGSEDFRLPGNSLETEICSTLDEISNVYASSSDEKINMVAIDKTSKVVQRIISEMDNFVETDPVTVVRRTDDVEHEQILAKLREMTSLAYESINEVNPVEYMAQDIMKNSKELVLKIDEVRRRSLVDVLARQLDSLNQYYNFPNTKRYCPNCVNEVMRNNSGDGMVVSIITSQASEDDITKERLDKRDKVLRSCLLKLNFRTGEWHCPLCSSIYDITDNESFYEMHQVKDEIIYPLWDILWMELSNEKAEIIREKERERRENINQELSELNNLLKEFADERRDLRAKANELMQTSISCSATLLSMIDTFEDYELISSGDAKKYRGRIEEMRMSQREDLAKLKDGLELAENDLKERSQAVSGRRSPLIDMVDEVKVKGRFFQVPSEAGLAAESVALRQSTETIQDGVYIDGVHIDRIMTEVYTKDVDSVNSDKATIGIDAYEEPIVDHSKNSDISKLYARGHAICDTCGGLVTNTGRCSKCGEMSLKEHQGIDGRWIVCPSCGKELDEEFGVCPQCKCELQNENIENSDVVQLSASDEGWKEYFLKDMNTNIDERD